MTKPEMLKKVRELISYYHQCGETISFSDIGELAQRILDASVHILNREGGIFDTGSHADICGLSDSHVIPRLIHRFNSLKETEVIPAEHGQCPFNEGKCTFEHRLHVISPLFYGGQHAGTLIYTKDTDNYDQLDIALAELIAMLAAQTLYTDTLNSEKVIKRQKSQLRQAKQSLSYTEQKAAAAIIHAANAEDGIINVSKISVQEGITRSVVAGAIRKLESAGIIKVRSLGMKGSYVSISNPFARDAFNDDTGF